MAVTTYRFKWIGVSEEVLSSNIDPSVIVAIIEAIPNEYIDISLDPGAPGSEAETDLKTVMMKIGWAPFSTNPATPIKNFCSQNQITFRPGVASDECNKQTWAEIESAIELAGGRITVVIDDRIAPAEIPATANTECFGFTVLTSLNPIQGAFLTVLDGGRLRNLAALKDSVILVAAPTAVRPLYFGGISGFQAFLLTGSVIGNAAGATVAMIEADCAFFEINSELISDMNNTAEPAIPIVHINAGNTFAWNAQQNADSPMSPNLIEGDATTTHLLFNDASIVAVNQTLFLGGFTNYSLTKAEALLPSSGAVRPTNKLTGQMFFDTSLIIPIPIFWNGANWINAAGSVV